MDIKWYRETFVNCVSCDKWLCDYVFIKSSYLLKIHTQVSMIKCLTSEICFKVLHFKACDGKGRQYGEFLEKFKIDLPYNPAIPSLSIYPKEIKAGFQ